MKIVKPQRKPVLFENLDNGNVFTSDRSGNTFTYMKIKPIFSYNAIDLENGHVTHFENSEKITPYWDASMTLE